jgi:acetylglutamate/LysW-gamma-L-alpha-aminoadipate kinase
MIRAVTVVKCGGNPAVEEARVCAGVARLARAGEQVVLAHGGSGEIDRLAAVLGVPQRRTVSPTGVASRHTDAATLDALTMALAGRVKPRLVARLLELGVAAVGLTGVDGGLLRARRKTAHRAVVDGRVVVVRDDLTGRIERVGVGLLLALLDAGFVPVVSPPALAEGGQVVNVDADRAAAAVAVALGAARLLLLTGAPGVLRDSADETTVMTRCELSRGGDGLPAVSGGMGLKLIAAREALEGGVAQVVIADGRRPDPVGDALAGLGTAVRLRPRELGEPREDAPLGQAAEVVG